MSLGTHHKISLLTGILLGCICLEASATSILTTDYVGSNSNTGFVFVTNSTQRMVLDTSGNLGIGINSPGAYKFYANGNAYISGSLSILGSLFVDTIVNRTVANISVSGGILPDSAAPLSVRNLGSNTQRWNNLYLSGQITVGGGSPGNGKVLTSDANGLATWQSAGAPCTPTGTYTWGDCYGSNSLQNNTTGDSNLALGDNSLTNNTTGYQNTVIGIYAANSNSGGYRNIAIGNDALGSNTDGNGNVAVGAFTMQNANFTDDNTAVGNDSLVNVTAGGGNVALGTYAMRNFTGGSNNISIGNASAQNLQSGDNNIFIGLVDPNFSNTGSNQLNIGNWIYGYNGDIGIGVPTPSTKLQVSEGKLSVMETNSAWGMLQLGNPTTPGTGNLSQTSISFMPGVSQFGAPSVSTERWELGANLFSGEYGTFGLYDATVGAYRLVVTMPDGYVGIGTSTPSAKLEVVGQVKITGGSPGNGKVLTSDANGLATWQTPSGGGGSSSGWSLSGNSIGANDFIGSTNAQNLVFKTNNTERLRITTTGSLILGGSFYIGGGQNRNVGSGVTVLGLNAMPSSTTAIEVIAIGSGAMGSNTSQSNNVAIGVRSMASFNNGDNNTAIGNFTLSKLSLASYRNTALGSSTLYNLASGNDNTAIGNQSLLNITTSDYNTALGSYASHIQISGSRNTAIGSYALYGNQDGANNTAVGNNALTALNTGGSANTMLGAGAGSGLTTGSFNIAIGYNAQLTVSTGSSQLNIGNWIYGSGGNIGIGTGSTAGSLTEKLIVNGTGSFNGIKLPTGAVNGYVLTSDALGNARWAAAGAGSNWQLTGNTGTTAGTNYIGTNDAQDLVFKTNSFEKLRIRNSDSDLMMSGSLRIGRGAGVVSSNTAFGVSSLSLNSTGSWNTAFGVNTLLSNTVGYNNTAVGEAALYSNTTGFQNTALGSGGPASFTTIGSANTAIGHAALYSNATGSNNVAIGGQALRNVMLSGGTTPNIAMGYQALYGGSGYALGNTAYDNIAIGYKSMFGTTGIASTGYRNVAIGNSALQTNTSGDQNTAVGFTSQSTNTTGYRNVSMGVFALRLVTTGSNNVGVGSDALYNVGNGISNVAIGSASMYYMSGGSYNVVIGDNAGFSTGMANYSYNTIIGASAGYSLTGSANSNTLIGYQAGYNITTGTSNILIGNNAQPTSATASNQLNIGNWIYGSGGNIGIGTGGTALGAKLTVAGQIKITGGSPGAGKVLTSDANGLATWQVASGSGGGGSTCVGTENICYGTDYVGSPSGSSNTSMGVASLNFLTSGNFNSAYGRGSLYNNTSGLGNTAMGYGALYTNDTTSYNTALGYYAMYNMDTGGVNGNGNVAVGPWALEFLTGGENNVAIGNASLGSLTFSDQYQPNTAVGGHSLENLDTGADNVALGGYAGRYITDGYMNVILGAGALGGNAAGIRNVARNVSIGTYSMMNAQSGVVDNVAIGYNALQNVSTGASNVSIGESAGLSISTGSYNIALGTASLGAMTSGFNNVSLGANAGAGMTTGDNNILIGSNVTGFNGVSNQLHIGDAIYASDIGLNAQKMMIGPAAVALFTPDYGMNIVGNNYDNLYPANFAVVDTNLMAANVGGGIAFLGNDDTIPNRTFALIQGAKENSTSGDRDGRLRFFVRKTTPDQLTEAMVLDSNGYLGIGTNVPFSMLTLSGGNLTVLRESASDAIVEPMSYANTGTTAPVIQFMRARGTRSSPSYPSLGDTLGVIRVQNPINPVNTAGIYFYAAQNQNSAGQAVDIAMSTTATGSSSGTERLRITSSGTVGIATTTPAARLDVNGTLKAGTGGTIITNMGVCNIASTAITTTATNYTCTGVPASTDVAVNCSANGTFQTPNTTSLYCRATGTANQVACNTTVANTTARTYKCMWMQ